AFGGLVQVALIWGIAVILAIYATRHLSCAHLNPAVSVGMTLIGRMEPRLLPWYMGSQLLGGIAAGVLMLAIFHVSISGYETAHAIIRGTPASLKTAMLFGEYYPNPGVHLNWLKVSMANAMLAEGFGTFLLVMMIFSLTEGCNVGRPNDGASPVFIGGTVTVLIAIFAPLTQAGFNPARDFGPRIVAYFAGWERIAIPGPDWGFLWVYIAAPMVGGFVASVIWSFVVEPLMRKRLVQAACSCGSAKIS
ncbi:MAG: MIP/aquaporin family protein, partial [Desulfomonilaceae bacterium]